MFYGGYPQIKKSGLQIAQWATSHRLATIISITSYKTAVQHCSAL
jgi:hypothetical protein